MRSRLGRDLAQGDLRARAISHDGPDFDQVDRCANEGEDPKRERPDDPEGLDSYPS
jgi:hypothetical protein